LFEFARHWARRSGVSERKEDLESVSAKKILVVTIEIVDVLVGVGVSVVRAEAIVVTTEDGVGGIIKVAVDVATAVTVVTSTEATTTTVLSAPNGHAVPAREAGGGVSDVEASLGTDIAEVYEDAEPQLGKELELVGRRRGASTVHCTAPGNRDVAAGPGDAGASGPGAAPDDTTATSARRSRRRRGASTVHCTAPDGRDVAAGPADAGAPGPGADPDDAIQMTRVNPRAGRRPRRRHSNDLG